MASPRLQDVACGHLPSVHPPRYRSLLEVRGDGPVMDAKFRSPAVDQGLKAVPYPPQRPAPLPR